MKSLWLIASMLCAWHAVAAADPDAASAEPGVAARWPRTNIERPLTLPATLVVAGSDVIALRTATATMTGSTTSLSWLADVAAGVGITDKLEINAVTPNYSFALSDFELAGPLDLGLGYAVVRGAFDGKLEVIGRAIGGYDLDARVARPIRVGVHAQYNVTPWLGVFSHDLGLGNAGLSFGVDDVHAVSMTLPIGVGVQAAPQLWLEVDTAPISTLDISNATSQFITDVTPVLATGVYTLMRGHLDAIGYFGCTDAQQAADTMTFGVGVRYYAGRVD